MQLRNLSTKQRILAAIVTALVLVACFYAGQSLAKTPERAKACQHANSVETCLRARLNAANKAIIWQKKARNHAKATTVREITLDAINWAAARYGVSARAMQTVANCESHLWPFAHNGQYLGAFQLGAMHRSDPIFDAVPWQDAYAQASHVARFVKAHGYSQWQCRPTGGLAW